MKSNNIPIHNEQDFASMRKAGNLAASIARKSFSNEKIKENLKFFIDSIKKEKPDTIKGEFIKNIFLTSTMGLSFKHD